MSILVMDVTVDTVKGILTSRGSSIYSMVYTKAMVVYDFNMQWIYPLVNVATQLWKDPPCYFSSSQTVTTFQRVYPINIPLNHNH